MIKRGKTHIVFFWAILFFAYNIPSAKSQNFLPDLKIEVGAQFNMSDTTPFWLVSNQNGKYSVANNSLFVNLGVEKQTESGKMFAYGYGAQLFNKLDTSYKPMLVEAFVELKLWELKFQAGRFIETHGNQDSILSGGSTIYTQNAMPIPKIQLSSNGYVALPFTKGYLEAKGLISHGWFENDRYVDNVWLHQKNLSGRIGGKLPVNFHLGLEHLAQWGGVSPKHGALPNDFEAFGKVFFADAGDSSKVFVTESINRLGNHVGAFFSGLDINLNRFKTSLYWQSIFEDRSGMRSHNFPDGLFGISLKLYYENFPISGFVYEFLHTTNQSGPVHEETTGQTGNDNYFNNGIYRSGWTHYKYVMGTPFITSPVYNQNQSIKVLNNRVKAHHLGLKGNFNSLEYRALVSHSLNWGTFKMPYSSVKKSYSFLVDLGYPLKKYQNVKINTQIGADFGKMYGNNFGMIVSLGWKK